VRVAVLGGLEHSLALYGAVEGVHLGAEVHLLEGIRPDRQRQALADRGVGVLYATPAQLRLMVEAGRAILPLRLVLVGGSKLDAGLRAGLAAMAPAAVVHEFYGAAEASFITLSGPDCPEGSVGRAYPGVEIAVEGGEIWVRSPYLFEGYAGADPGGARWRDGWLSVGEMGRLEDGFLYLSGRAGRMVTVADQNVFPEEIEGFLLGLPGVERAAVLPRPDALRGVHLVAVLRGERAREADILAACRAHLGALKAPKALHWLEDWPALPSGKTDLAGVERVLGWR
jgi:long-chain acyl-CoA synthetase